VGGGVRFGATGKERGGGGKTHACVGGLGCGLSWPVLRGGIGRGGVKPKDSQAGMGSKLEIPKGHKKMTQTTKESKMGNPTAVGKYPKEKKTRLAYR